MNKWQKIKYIQYTKFIQLSSGIYNIVVNFGSFRPKWTNKFGLDIGPNQITPSKIFGTNFGPFGWNSGFQFEIQHFFQNLDFIIFFCFSFSSLFFLLLILFLFPPLCVIPCFSLFYSSFLHGFLYLWRIKAS